jgi:hypothetical protein
MSHSPAPWHHAPEGGNTGFVTDDGGNLICQLFDNTDNGLDPIDQEQSDFNLALIIAAPDLLEALGALRWYHENEPDRADLLREAMKKTRAAIAKATTPLDD